MGLRALFVHQGRLCVHELDISSWPQLLQLPHRGLASFAKTTVPKCRSVDEVVCGVTSASMSICQTMVTKQRALTFLAGNRACCLADNNRTCFVAGNLSCFLAVVTKQKSFLHEAGRFSWRPRNKAELIATSQSARQCGRSRQDLVHEGYEFVALGLGTRGASRSLYYNPTRGLALAPPPLLHTHSLQSSLPRSCLPCCSLSPSLTLREALRVV